MLAYSISGKKLKQLKGTYFKLTVTNTELKDTRTLNFMGKIPKTGIIYISKGDLENR